MSCFVISVFLLGSARAQTEINLQLYITGEIRGAVFPISQENKRACDFDIWKKSPCQCVGGAASRKTILDPANKSPNQVWLDTGGYFYGSGLFYPTFRGRASAEFFASSGYDAFGLTYRDFNAGGTRGLADYLSRAREFNSTVPPAVVTNLDLAGDQILTSQYIVPYTIIKLPNNLEMAVLSLLDPTYVIPVNREYAERILPFNRSLRVATWNLMQRATKPALVVLMISGIPVTPQEVASHGSFNVAMEHAVDQLVAESLGVDLVLLGGNAAGGGNFRSVRNLLDENVFVIPVNAEAKGTVVEVLDLTIIDEQLVGLEEMIRRAQAPTRQIPLACDNADPIVNARLEVLHEEIDGQMNVDLGRTTGAEGRRAFVLSAGTSDEACTRFPTQPPTFACGCRVAACGAGALVADAFKATANADIALVNGGSIRAGFDGGAGVPVTRGDILQMLPFQNEVVKIKNLPGSTLKRALEHGLSQISFCGVDAPECWRRSLVENSIQEIAGHFLQVSGLSLQWRFRGGVPVIFSLRTDGGHDRGREILDNETYSVAMSTYLANGGDDYDMFNNMSLQKEDFGILDYQSVEALFRERDGTTITGYQNVGNRIDQMAALTDLRVGVLCGTERQSCDSMLWALASISNKEDGFFDDLVTDIIFTPVVEMVGCGSAGNARRVFRELYQEHSFDVVFGLPCSTDLTDVSSTEFRDEVGHHNVLIISPSSTAAILATNRQQYPYVVRAVTSDVTMGQGMALVFKEFGWTRIAIMKNPDDVWSMGAADAAKTNFLNTAGNAILAEVSFALTPWNRERPDLAEQLATAGDLVDQLVASRARIFYACTQPPVMQQVFALAFTRGEVSGAGFAWLSGWLTRLSFEVVNPDSGMYEVDSDSIFGGQGLIGLVEAYDDEAPNFKQFSNLWAQVSNSKACETVPSGTGSPTTFCDLDDDGTTFSSYAPFNVDAVLIYARALNAVLAEGQTNTVANVYNKILNMAEFDGVAGSIKMDSNIADRSGTYFVRNFQITFANNRRLRSDANRRLSQLSLKATTAEFVNVGRYSAEGGLIIDRGQVVFSDGTSDVPPDTLADNTQVVETGIDAGVIVAIVAGVVVLGCCLFGCYFRYAQGEQRKLKEEMESLKNQIVGVRAVVEDYWPADAGKSVSPVPSLNTKPTSQSIGASTSNWSAWYWQEDEQRIGAHNQLEVFQPGNYVKFAGSVCAELEEHHAYWTQDPFTYPAKRKIGLTDRISSTGTEQKAFAKDSGTDFEIDFAAMTQRNLRTGYVRKILRREIAQPQKDAVPIARRSKTQTNQQTVSKDKPADLKNDDTLVLYTGQLLQASKQRPDGWAFGTIIFDEVDGRDDLAKELPPGISQSGGWFPLDKTEHPTTEQMTKLQALMGGAGAVDALATPDYWEEVKDPAQCQLFPLKDGPEKAKVVNAFMTTLPAGSVKVVGVDRIENISLWQSYAVKRQTVFQRDSKNSSRFERVWLFHGTTADVAPKITEQGFNRSFNGRNATMYGKGVYFARDASYSANAAYARPSDVSGEKGVQRMFLCRVVVGEYCQGVKDAIAPPSRSKKHVDRLYDTTVDNERSPSIFVTYHDGQAYPD